MDNPIPPIPVDFAAMSTVVEKNLWKKKRLIQVYFVNRKTFHIRLFLYLIAGCFLSRFSINSLDFQKHPFNKRIK